MTAKSISDPVVLNRVTLLRHSMLRRVRMNHLTVAEPRRAAMRESARHDALYAGVWNWLAFLILKSNVFLASLEQEVYDALMLVKRLGRDVREGKRRQYNYIGRLLREVEPELMDSLIQATKDGDQNPFKKFASEEALSDDGEEEGEEEVSDEHEEEDPLSVAVAIRWYDGLIAKNTTITNEIYSLQDVDFDRQELRQLVRKVHASLEAEASLEDHGKPITAAVKARRSLMQFLQHVAKQLPDECAINRFHYE
ncbi:uncharacterized protein LOC127246818 isoform X4 [Andrographis paniculata]|uniref:uncharacterized protein LOC127246818 isoform X4 n=1 Tax=Andrographis paniculata TaxID=175694 RepID=UPI0021E793B9|nr:uncharacterized protein LOC127246818 isoform X4 [Andrographis paniculata]